MADVRVMTITYGGTIVLDHGKFKQEKRWVAYEAEVSHNESPNVVLEELRNRFDKWEEEERSRANEKAFR